MGPSATGQVGRERSRDERSRKGSGSGGVHGVAGADDGCGTGVCQQRGGARALVEGVPRRRRRHGARAGARAGLFRVAGLVRRRLFGGDDVHPVPRLRVHDAGGFPTRARQADARRGVSVLPRQRPAERGAWPFRHLVGHHRDRLFQARHGADGGPDAVPAHGALLDTDGGRVGVHDRSAAGAPVLHAAPGGVGPRRDG